MTRELNDVVVIDAVRTAFGRAGEKGIFWDTRAEDLCVPLVKALIARNLAVKPEMIEDSIWGVTNQVKEQGLLRTRRWNREDRCMPGVHRLDLELLDLRTW